MYIESILKAIILALLLLAFIIFAIWFKFLFTPFGGFYISMLAMFFIYEFGLVRREILKTKSYHMVFAKRNSLSVIEFYEKYYRDSDIPMENIALLLSELEIALELPVNKLDPSDKFNKELASSTTCISQNDLISLMDYILEDRYFYLKIKEEDQIWIFENIITLDDYIRYFGKWSFKDLFKSSIISRRKLKKVLLNQIPIDRHKLAFET